MDWRQRIEWRGPSLRNKVNAFNGKNANLLTASLEGFSMLLMGKERKLAKVYETGNAKLSYNISIVVDSSNHITKIDAYRVEWAEGSGAEVIEETNIPDDIMSNLEKDLLKITTE